jgi:hypothetical protein
MSDLVPESFARELAADIDEAVRSEKESPYHEQEFTRIILDRLSDEGALENPFRCGRRAPSKERSTASAAIRRRMMKSALP